MSMSIDESAEPIAIPKDIGFDAETIAEIIAWAREAASRPMSNERALQLARIWDLP